eukprot:TRINITY_DN5575_c0_g1_i1.p1 TRINITY_DN5575_c0_g1~~TRINITY_DN5575_c0_g1_i1.p1  ORF type:complete len:215 (+),score=41.90 TRINITY_DN5575_c0_g1_i1:99-743(+)
MSTTQAKLVLFSYFRSSCSYRVRIALAYKGIEYEYKAVNLLKGEQREEAFAKINPTKLVPALKLPDSTILTESLAIIEYLEETYPQPSLLPKDAIGRAKVRSLSEVIACDIQPIQNLRILQHRLIGETNRSDWASEWITAGFDSFEAMLKDFSGKYCYGDNVTLADLCLVPQILNSQRFNLDLSKWPTIKKVYENLMEVEAFKVAHPSKMPDAV